MYKLYEAKAGLGKEPDLLTKWAPIVNHDDLPKIEDAYKREVLSILLENQENENAFSDGGEQFFKSRQQLTEAPTGGHANAAAGFPNNNPDLKGYDPILISMLRRAMPNLMPFDVCGIQPMRSPTGLVFALKARYASQDGNEALHFEADTTFSGTGTHTDPLVPDAIGLADTGGGRDTPDGEKLGSGAPEPEWPEMAISIDKISITAKSRNLKAEYTRELAQDLEAVHGLDAEAELANILSAEILTEINREVIRKLYAIAEVGAINTAVPGTFDCDQDANGRWSVEKFKGLMLQLEFEANQIATRTRRGRGNFIICDSDTASALSMTGLLDFAPALKDNLNVDDTGNTFVGVLNGRFKVYIDPYVLLTNHYAVVGYKGPNAWDAGMYYCPYVPLQMVRAIDPGSFQPKIGFQTRYSIAMNPFSNLAGDSDGTLVNNTNVYFRKVNIENLLSS